MNTLASNDFSTITLNINKKEESVPTKEINPKEVEKFVEDVSQFFNKKLVEAAARSSGFVERESKLTGSLFLSIFTFGMSIYGMPTLNQLIGLLNVIVPKLEIRREGLHQRINQKAVNFFEYMLSQAVHLTIPKSLDLKILDVFDHVLIVDSTSFELPKELAEIFKGSGGSASESAIKIQFGYDLKSSQFFYLIEDGTCPDNLYKNNFINEIGPGDLTIKDLGYFNIRTFIDLDQRGAYYLSRMKSGVSLFVKDEDGNLVEFDLISFCERVKNNIAEIEVYMQKDGLITKTRLVIEKVPDEVKSQRLRKINSNNKKKGYTTSQETKILQGFNLHISNAPKEKLAKKNFRILYTVRWQVELVFKIWKKNFSLDHVSGIREERIKCMLYAKLLFIFISTRIIYLARNYLWWEMNKEVSESKAANHMKVIAQEWMKLIIQNPIEIRQLLINAFNFIIKHCVKIEQYGRTYPLQILANLS